MSRRLVALLGALTVALAPVAAVAGMPAAAAPAARTADRTTDRTTVTVDSLSPVSVHDGDTLTLSGTVTLTGSAPIDGLHLLVGVGSPVRDRRGLLSDFTGDPGVRRVLRTCTTGCLASTLTGGSLGYRAVIPLGSTLDVDFTTVYPLIVRVLDRDDETVGQATSYLPFVSAVSSPLHVSWLVPLQAQPPLDASGAVVDAAFPAELRSGGPGRLLGDAVAAGTGSAPVTYAVDPSLLAAAQLTATDGWHRSGGSAAQSANGASTAFLQSLATATRGRGVLALPYGDTDATAVTHAGLGIDLSKAVATGRAALARELPGAQVLAGYGWVPGTAVDGATLDTYASAGTTTLVLPGEQAPSDDDASPPTQSAVTSVQTDSAPLRGLATDPDLEALLATGGAGDPTVRMSVQRLLALLATTLGEAPNDRSVRDVVLAVPRGTVPRSGLLTAALQDTGTQAWLRAEPLAATAGDPEGERTLLSTYPASARAAELPGLTRVPATRAQVDQLGSTLPDTDLTRPLDLAVTAAESVAWRGDPGGSTALLAGVATAAQAMLHAIRLAAAPTITLGSHRAQIPVTVENQLSESVRVRVQLSSSDPSKLSGAGQTVLVPAGRKQRVQLDASTDRSGTFRAQVSLTTPGGLAVSRSTITVHSRAYGALSIGITVGALVVLVLALLARSVRRIRRTRQAGP